MSRERQMQVPSILGSNFNVALYACNPLQYYQFTLGCDEADGKSAMPSSKASSFTSNNQISRRLPSNTLCLVRTVCQRNLKNPYLFGGMGVWEGREGGLCKLVQSASQSHIRTYKLQRQVSCIDRGIYTYLG